MQGYDKELKEIDATIRDLNRKRQDIMLRVYCCTESVYTDQTGRFPVTSSRSYKYIMDLCEIDSNQILVAPLKNCKEHTIIATHKTLIERLKAMGINPKIQYLDNKASAA
jgi:hypothetical protein